MLLVSPTAILKAQRKQEEELAALRERINKRFLRIPTPVEMYYERKIREQIKTLRLAFRTSVEWMLDHKNNHVFH